MEDFRLLPLIEPGEERADVEEAQTRAAGLGVESLAARFKAGDGLEGYFGRWLLLEAAGGDVEAEDNLATSRQIHSSASSWARS